MLGDDIEVSVLAVGGEKVRLGISAPKAVPVFRTEVFVEVQEDRRDGSDVREAVDGALDRLKAGE